METAVYDPVKETLKYVEEDGVCSGGEDKVAALKKEIAACEKLLGSLLDVETASREEIGAKLESLRVQLNVEEILKRAPELGLTKINLDQPLRWRNNQGMPRLAIFSLNSPRMEFSAGFTGNGWQHDKSNIFPRLPDVLGRCFNDVREKLYQHSRREYRASFSRIERTTVSASVEFRGLIPPATKEKIRQARAVFGDQIFLVGEAPSEWKLEEKKDIQIIPRSDPLVIGVFGDSVWLIAAFDLTKLENALREFIE